MIYFSIGDLVLMESGEPTTGILLQTPIEGLEAPNQRMNAYARAGQDGQVVSSQFYDDRVLKVVGMVTGETPAEFEGYRRDLIAATAIGRDGSRYPVPVRVRFTTLAGGTYYLDVYFNKPVMDLNSPIDCDFLLTGVCADPFVRSGAVEESEAISPPSGGGYEVPMIVPYISAPSTGGAVIVTNPGTVEAWPLITLTGPLMTPVVTNVTTGKYLQLDYSIASGDEVIIDMANHTITLNGASLISTKTASSDWWSLDPGSNTITLTTTGSGDTGLMVASFYPPFIGV